MSQKAATPPPCRASDAIAHMHHGRRQRREHLAQSSTSGARRFCGLRASREPPRRSGTSQARHVDHGFPRYANLSMRDLALRGHVAGDDALCGGALKIQPRLRATAPRGHSSRTMTCYPPLTHRRHGCPFPPYIVLGVGRPLSTFSDSTDVLDGLSHVFRWCYGSQRAEVSSTKSGVR